METSKFQWETTWILSYGVMAFVSWDEAPKLSAMPSSMGIDLDPNSWRC